jgi:hypothetical protein
MKGSLPECESNMLEFGMILTVVDKSFSVIKAASSVDATSKGAISKPFPHAYIVYPAIMIMRNKHTCLRRVNTKKVLPASFDGK